MKIIDKYLDKYYAAKLAKFLHDCVRWECAGDCKIETESDGTVHIMAKRRNLKDCFYATIYDFRRSDALSILCDQRWAREHIMQKYKELADYQEKTL